ncbi:efflux transporter outer membrane subunit [Marinobacterium sp. D7]|uniref:efflux transporter outer membrane subunit n=1 Tax=Marinobacterium ramblicola TaxID=2849041 RepID=UPI001C2DDE95|nr:efflux transporter outer membrane subunit [Marinobacterium ramblicola]MBV1786857.1 efflux transporter outer membrane subunit [Marinobacterium ramblicola]
MLLNRQSLTPSRPRATKPGGTLLLALAAIVLLPGCNTLGPDFNRREPEAPAAWSDWHSAQQAWDDPAIDTDNTPAAQWWREFDDPVLNRLQQRLPEASPDLRSAMLNFSRSRLQRQLAANVGVDIAANGGLSRQKLSEHGAQMRMAAISAPGNQDALISALAKPYPLYQAGFDAGWEPDLWGRVSRTVESADANTEASAALLAQTRLALHAELARAYFELRAQQRQIALLNAEIALSEAQLALLEANRQAGLVSEMQLESLRQQLDEQRAALPPLHSAAVASENAIALMLGEQPGALSELLTADTSAEEEPEIQADLSLGLPSELARRRPDIRAAEARLHAATAEIGVAMADLYPRVTLSAGFGFESFEQGAFGDWASRRWSIGPGFYLPIFNQGRLKTRVELTRLAQQQAAVAYQQTVLAAWQEVDNALSGYSAERQRYRQLQRKLQSAQRRRQLSKAEVDAGLSDANIELQAESQVLAIERQLAQSRAVLKIQRVAVYKAVGGGVEIQNMQERKRSTE